MSVEIWLWGAAAIGSTIGLGYLGNRVMFARMRRRWRALANELSLTFDEARWRIHGNRDGLHLEVARIGDGSWEAVARVRGLAPLSLSVRPRTFAEPLKSPLWDTEFDRQFIVQGSPVQVLALLDAELRRAWLHESVRRWTLDGDDQGWELEATFSMEVTSLLRPVVTEGLALGRRIADSARCFTDPRGPTAYALALIERLGDPSPQIRAWVAKTLSVYLRSQPEVAPALTQTLQDPEPEVRLQAALVLERADILAEVAQAANASTASRLLAFRRALELAPAEASTRALVRAWAFGSDTGRRLEAIAAIHQVIMEREALTLEVLTHVEQAPDEASLLALFASLAMHGTPKCVPRLLPYRDRFFDSTLKAAAHDAIVAIQARAGGSTGALSLAQGGELSEPG